MQLNPASCLAPKYQRNSAYCKLPFFNLLLLKNDFQSRIDTDNFRALYPQTVHQTLLVKNKSINIVLQCRDSSYLSHTFDQHHDIQRQASNESESELSMHLTWLGQDFHGLFLCDELGI